MRERTLNHHHGVASQTLQARETWHHRLQPANGSATFPPITFGTAPDPLHIPLHPCPLLRGPLLRGRLLHLHTLLPLLLHSPGYHRFNDVHSGLTGPPREPNDSLLNQTSLRPQHPTPFTTSTSTSTTTSSTFTPTTTPNTSSIFTQSFTPTTPGFIRQHDSEPGFSPGLRPAHRVNGQRAKDAAGWGMESPQRGVQLEVGSDVLWG